MGWILCRESIALLERSTDGRFSIVEKPGVVTLKDSVTGASYALLEFRGMTPKQLAAVATLSRREHDTFVMLGDGKTLREVAEAFGISVKTAETYHARIKQKLEVKMANELLALAVAWKIDVDERKSNCEPGQ
ncbi:MAG: helix-turn-helix transcriptional regulator [Pirellulales bacterium]